MTALDNHLKEGKGREKVRKMMEGTEKPQRGGKDDREQFRKDGKKIFAIPCQHLCKSYIKTYTMNPASIVLNSDGLTQTALLSESGIVCST